MSHPLLKVVRGVPLRYVASIAVLALVYVAVAKLALHQFIFVRAHVSAAWPANGVALAIVVLGGRAMWPAIALGTLINVWTSGLPAWVGPGMAVGNTIDALLGASLLRWARFDPSLGSVRDVVTLLCAALVSSLASAVMGGASLALHGIVTWRDFFGQSVTWWLSHAVGVLVTAPMILTWGSELPRRWKVERPVELVVMTALIVLIVHVMFGNVLGNGFSYPFFIFPLMLWPALRFNPRIAATVVFVLAMVTIWHTARDAGPFAHAELFRGILLFQAFLAVISVTTEALASAVATSRRAEEDLRRMVSSLARSNAELERFAWVASHDLQEPLRQVTSYTQLLQKRYGGRLDPDADEFIRFAVDGAKRMYALVNGLLAYSQVGRDARPPRVCDPRVAVDEALARLKPVIAESGAQVTVGPMPLVSAELTDLEMIFQNLIGNAIKYRSRERPLRVDVRCERTEDAWRFTVEDNGIGMDSEYLDQIFLIFKRLHGPAEYSGTGLGLAVCKKVIERYGGRVWAESQSGQGSRFHFTLPLEPRDEAAGVDLAAPQMPGNVRASRRIQWH